MEPYLDMETFEKLQPEILSGFAVAREFAKEGTWMAPGFTFDDMSYRPHWKPIYEAMQEFIALPDSPLKQAGLILMPKDFKNFIGQEKLKLVKQAVMQQFQTDPEKYSKALTQFSQIADPNVLQYSSMTEAEQKRFKSSMTENEQKSFEKKLHALDVLNKKYNLGLM